MRRGFRPLCVMGIFVLKQMLLYSIHHSPSSLTSLITESSFGFVSLMHSNMLKLQQSIYLNAVKTFFHAFGQNVAHTLQLLSSSMKFYSFRLCLDLWLFSVLFWSCWSPAFTGSSWCYANNLQQRSTAEVLSAICKFYHLVKATCYILQNYLTIDYADEKALTYQDTRGVAHLYVSLYSSVSPSLPKVHILLTSYTPTDFNQSANQPGGQCIPLGN